jgi:hypothetical protein
MLKNNSKIRKLMLATGEVTSLAGGAQGSADGIGGQFLYAVFRGHFSRRYSPTILVVKNSHGCYR